MQCAWSYSPNEEGSKGGVNGLSQDGTKEKGPDQEKNPPNQDRKVPAQEKPAPDQWFPGPRRL